MEEVLWKRLGSPQALSGEESYGYRVIDVTSMSYEMKDKPWIHVSRRGGDLVFVQLLPESQTKEIQ